MIVTVLLVFFPIIQLCAEQEHSIPVALSETTLSGIVNTSAIWSIPRTNEVSVSFEGPIWLFGSWVTNLVECDSNQDQSMTVCMPKDWLHAEAHPILTIRARPGARYRLEYASIVGNTTEWLLLSEIELPPLTETVHVIDPSPAIDKSRFYRGTVVSENGVGSLR